MQLAARVGAAPAAQPGSASAGQELLRLRAAVVAGVVVAGAAEPASAEAAAVAVPGFGFWVLDFGLWVLGFGFGFWVLGFGV